MNQLRPIANPEAERAVLGHCFTDEAALCQVMAALGPDSFSDPACAGVHAAMQAVQKKGGTVDHVSVWTALTSSGDTFGMRGIDDLARLETYARGSLAAKIKLVSNAAKVRFVQGSAARLAAEGMNPAVVESPEEYFASFVKAAQESVSGADKGAVHIRQAMIDTFTEIVAQRKRKGKTQCPTGFVALDPLLNGWEPKDVNVIAARPSAGKSAFMLQAATNGAFAGHPQRIFSLEMDNFGLNKRQLSFMSKINANLIGSPHMVASEWKSLIAAGDKLSRLPMWFDDETMAWSAIVSKIEAWALTEAADHIAAHKARQLELEEAEIVLVPVVWVDYLQIAGPENERDVRERQLAKMSRSAKLLAKRLGIAINLLCQIGRGSEKDNRRPRQSDLRESGAIEQDASKIVFIHPKDLNDEDHPGGDVREAIVAKNRNGSQGLIDLRYIGPQTRFETL